MTIEQEPTKLRKFEFTHPNNGINKDLLLGGDVSNNQLQPINTISDEDSFELNLDDFKHTLPLCSSNIASDDRNHEELEESSSNTSENESSCPSSESRMLSVTLSSVKTKPVPSPVFTEQFCILENDADVNQNENKNLKKDLLKSIVDESDKSSSNSGTTISQLLNLEQLTIDTNISSAIKNAELDLPQERKLYKNNGNAYSEPPMTQRCVLESVHIGTSKIFENEGVASKSALNVQEKPNNELMDVNATSAGSRGFAQLLFLSLIEAYKSASAKKLSDKTLAKQDADAKLNYATKIHLSLVSGLISLFKEHRSPDIYKKLNVQLFKKLSVVFANQKLYVDTKKRGEVISVIYYPFREWRIIEFTSMRGTRLTSIIKGDGWSSFKVPGTVDFKIITRGSGRSWTKELFQPIVMFPKLDKVREHEDPDTLLNHFSPLLSIIPETKKEIAKQVLKNGAPIILQDVLEAKPLAHRKKLSKHLLNVVETHVIGHYKSIRIKKSEILRVEGSIHQSFNDVIDAVVKGYIEAFNFIDSYNSLYMHGSEEIYVKIYEFYKNCPVVDLGNLLLQAVCTPTLNEVIFKRKMAGEKSLDIMEYIIARNYMKTDSLTLGYLRLMAAYIQSPYVTKHILRRLLFWADNIKMDTLTYARNYTWVKSNPEVFENQIVVSIRDQAVAHFKDQA